MPGNIVLIGLSGSGKTSVGKLLAERLSWQFFDSDMLIAQQYGRSVAAIFADLGEAAFRDIEAEMIAELTNGSRRVISTGGGAVLREDNRLAMQEGNLVVRLDAPPEVAVQRMLNVTTEERPLLRGGDPLERMRAMRVAREPYYRIAQFMVPTGSLTPQQVVNAIQENMQEESLRRSKVGRLINLALAHTRLAKAAQAVQPDFGLPDRFNQREILIHVAAWDAELLRLLPDIAAGNPLQKYDIDAFNQAALAAHAQQSQDEVWKTFIQTGRQLEAALADLPESAFAKDSPVLTWVRILTHHSNEHAATLESGGNG